MKSKAGFTLAEVIIAAAVSLIVVTMAMVIFIEQLEDEYENFVENGLAVDLEMSVELIRKDLRLSSVGTSVMAFYPANASEYTAISFPAGTDTNGDGVMDFQRDADNKIIWAQTVIYHVRPISPNQLLRTVYSPRNTNATPSDLYDQLVDVVASSNDQDLADAVMTGESVASRVLFENLVDLSIKPSDVVFDGYAASQEKAGTVNFGSIVLSNGIHDVKFTVTGTNPLSSGFKIGIDKLCLSLSGSDREGEIFYPINSHPSNSSYFQYSRSGGSVSAEDMSSHGANWSGNCQLTYDAGATNNSITLKIGNDLWTDSNFDTPRPEVQSNVVTTFDTATFSPGDVIVQMDKGTAWRADATTETTGQLITSDPSVDLKIINVVHGTDHATASAIYRNGAWSRFQFKAGPSNACKIVNATVAERQSGYTPVGAPVTLSFATNIITAGSSVWSTPVNFVISKDKSYLVTLEFMHHGGGGNAAIYSRTRTSDSAEMSYTSTPPAAPVSGSTIYGLSEIEVRYPSNGVFRSGIFDTQIDDPVYNDMKWTCVEYGAGPDGDVDLRVRSGDEPDLSDAGAWECGGHSTGYFQSGTTANDISPLSGGRYVQYEALFTSRGTNDYTAKLQDVTIDWAVPAGIADLRADFGKGPDYGMVEATVDGQICSKGIEIEMAIYKETRYRRKTVSGIMEVRPLNTGK